MNTYNTHLEAKVGEQNHAHRLIVEWFPKVVAALKPFEGQKVINQTGILNQKVRNAIEALGLPNTAAEAVWVSTNNYSASLRVKTSGIYRNHFACYAEQYTTVADIPNNTLTIEKIPNADQCPDFRTDYTVAEVEAARTELKAAQRALDVVRSKLNYFGEHDSH